MATLIDTSHVTVPEVSFTTNSPDAMRQFLNGLQSHLKKAVEPLTTLLTEIAESNNLGSVEFEVVPDENRKLLNGCTD